MNSNSFALRLLCILSITFLASACASHYSSAYSEAYGQRQKELTSIPMRLYTDSLTVEGAVLQNDTLFEMLSLRGLNFIEVKIRRPNTKAHENEGYLSMLSADTDKPLTVSMKGVREKYVRIELQDLKHANCIRNEKLPASFGRRINNPPILPNTCLSITFISAPSASMVLAYEDNHPWGRPFGYWSLTDRTSKIRLAALTSPDNDEKPSNGNSGHRDLTNRIWNYDNQRIDNHRALKKVTVMARPTILEIISKIDDLPLLQMKSQNTPFRDGEWESYFTAYPGWQDAVNEAMQKGVASYDGEGECCRFGAGYEIASAPHGKGRVLDWHNKSVLGIQLVNTGTPIRSKISWEVSASEGGFLVFAGDWRIPSKNFLVKYRVNGSLEWAVKIPDDKIQEGCGFGPMRAWATEVDIVLTQPSCNKVEGKEWRISKKAILLSYLKSKSIGVLPNASSGSVK